MPISRTKIYPSKNGMAFLLNLTDTIESSTFGSNHAVVRTATIAA
jgi:hypothetical protein